MLVRLVSAVWLALSGVASDMAQAEYEAIVAVFKEPDQSIWLPTWLPGGRHELRVATWQATAA